MAGTNSYVGTSANNSWQVVNPGTFTLDGLGGVDTLALGTSLRSSYTITQGSDGAVHVDSVSGASAALHATLHNMERLTFNSGRDVLDLTTYFGPPTSSTTSVNGTSANDTLQLPAGLVNVDGLGGLDTVVISQASDAFVISKNSSGFTVTSKDGTSLYSLTNVERVQFNNDKVAFDLGTSGHAADVAKVLGAVFGPSSVGNASYVGIGLRYLDGGTSYAELMALALGAVLPASASNADVVGLLYKNVVGVAPTAAQAQAYVDALDNKTYSQAQLGLMAADTAINQANVGLTGVLLQTGLHYA